MFLAFQYPMEIPGVASLTFLRTAMNAHRKARGEGEISIPEFMRVVKAEAAKLGISFDMLKRPVNTGFSGGEKKRNEVLQMALLQPSLHPRRDGLRPRYRRDPYRGRGREPPALAGAVDPR